MWSLAQCECDPQHSVLPKYKQSCWDCDSPAQGLVGNRDSKSLLTPCLEDAAFPHVVPSHAFLTSHFDRMAPDGCQHRKATGFLHKILHAHSTKVCNGRGGGRAGPQSEDQPQAGGIV